MKKQKASWWKVYYNVESRKEIPLCKSIMKTNKLKKFKYKKPNLLTKIIQGFLIWLKNRNCSRR